MKSILGIIPARSGSKRLPGKNMKLLGGKTLVQMACEQAKENFSFSVLTTDNGALMQEAVRCGVQFILRPSELSTDDASSGDVVKHVFVQYPFFEYFCLLQPTSPLRTNEDISKCIELVESSGKNVYSTFNGKPNGAIYICKTHGFDGNFSNGIQYEMPEERSIDIDTIEDFERAEEYLFGPRIVYADGHVGRGK